MEITKERVENHICNTPTWTVGMRKMIYYVRVIMESANKLGRSIKIGGILGNWIIKDPNMTELIFKRIRYLLNKPKKKKARKDFGHFLLTLPLQPITKAEFEQLMLKKKIKKLDAPLIQQLEDLYTIKKNKKIDAAAMVQTYMDLWPDTCLPPLKPKKEKKKKKDKKRKKKGEEKPVEGEQVSEQVGEKVGEQIGEQVGEQVNEIQPTTADSPPPVEGEPIEASQTHLERQQLEAPIEDQPSEATQLPDTSGES